VKVLFSKTAAKNYHHLPLYLQSAIASRLEKLAADPQTRALDVKPVRGDAEHAFRLRVGPVRVVYVLTEESINVYSIGFRGDVYK
jgi:mRNA-degrading endonuclease RelE of RelBE toxin-antitoxin system